MEVEQSEELLGPEDVDFSRILKEARDERGRKIFETFSSDGLSFMVAEWSRWDKYKRAHGDKIRRHLQVMAGGEDTRNS